MPTKTEIIELTEQIDEKGRPTREAVQTMARWVREACEGHYESLADDDQNAEWLATGGSPALWFLNRTMRPAESVEISTCFVTGGDWHITDGWEIDIFICNEGGLSIRGINLAFLMNAAALWIIEDMGERSPALPRKGEPELRLLKTNSK